MAAVAALKEGQSSDDRMVTEFRSRRDVIVEGLRQIPGFQCARPEGAFYVFPNITRTGHSSRTLANAPPDRT